MTLSLFSVVEAPELYITRERAITLAQTVRSWGYRASVHDKRDRSDRGWAVAVSSNNGFEGYAHAL